MTPPSLPLEQMLEKSAEAAEFLRLFSTQSRLMLLCFISQKERSVGEIQEELAFKQPALSQQLAELRQAGVVRTRRESRQIFYSIADERVDAVLQTLLKLFCPPPTSHSKQGEAKAASSPAPHPLGEMAQWAIIDASEQNSS
ncbi:ArsR/SmtB family transcription factor [Rhizobium helianthi]|uniref:ArsR/SmtB family transcription factor n=1 Tax=Rhizobium helianthi TaxID=1132695 RepID=A0ABW4M125_9HYPH